MNTEIVEQIVKNTSPKTSTQIVVSGNSTKIHTFFPIQSRWTAHESTRWLWSNWRLVIVFQIIIQATIFFDILLVSLK